MQNERIFISILPVFIFCLALSGCSDNPSNIIITSPSPITVSGKVVNVVNQAVPNVMVEIGGQSVLTSADGSFAIGNVTTPYNLKTTEVGNVTKYYYGISAGQIRIPGEGNSYDSVHCEISVTFPPEIITPGISGKIMFTDFNYVNAYEPLSQGSSLDVWLPDNSPVTGKLVLISYKTIASGKITSYENFGQSAPIQVTNGGSYSYDFSMSEVSLNPDEETLSGTINGQPGFTEGNTAYYLTFSNKRTPNYLTLIAFENISGNIFNIVAPKNLPLQFSNLMFHFSYNVPLLNFELFKLPAEPSGIILDTKSAPELLTPEDNAVNITFSTLFSYTAGTGTGIYRVNLFDQTSQRSYIIFTSLNSFNLSQFSDLFPKGISNSIFKWSVEKIGFSNSINEYVTLYSDRPEYFRTNTTERSFTTVK